MPESWSMPRPMLPNLESPPLELKSEFGPCGDQPKAIAALIDGVKSGIRYQTLLGVTGSGKTFTIANVLANINRPALIIAPNKTLAAQLYSEFRELFPNNRVRYFVSYYDYYQPEAYVPSTDTYIEKDSAINEEIDKMRHSATKALLEGRDTIIVASVSCIYGLGAPEEYFAMMVFVEKGERIKRDDVLRKLVQIQYQRSDVEFKRGSFRVRGEVLDVFPASENAKGIRIIFFGDEVEDIQEIDSVTSSRLKSMPYAAIFPVSHFVTRGPNVERALKTIKQELDSWVIELQNRGKVLEADRIKSRTNYDLELLDEVGFCPGIENYSRHLTGRAAGQPPDTLIDYFPDDLLLILDESHVTAPQLGAMYRGDRSRKNTLVEYGFRLPSALDNRPLNGEEFWSKVGQTIFVSATPADFELERSKEHVVEQIIRPTGLLDPVIDVRPATNQVDDLIEEIRKTIAAGDRALVLTLTKKMAEELSEYFRNINVKAKYIHADIQTIERTELLMGLRKGEFDVLIGINLLREGLDLVEVSLVAVLDADKEGFLRSTRSLVQIMGRAARNINGHVILYGDKTTGSMAAAISETNRRRKIQQEYNTANGIVPRSARSGIKSSILPGPVDLEISLPTGELSIPRDRAGQTKLVESLRKQMFDAAAKREFERAAELRDAINKIQNALLLE